MVGRLARGKAAEVPGRVAHSAKSWLCHHTTDRSAAFLPWGSEDIGNDRKISPIRASALILNALRGAWDDRFAGSGAEFRFDAQEITVTVPASFDAAAQRLTLEAAAEAGFPTTVRLLEEPQAAFYRWLEQHGSTGELWGRLPNPDAEVHHVLVVDIGGGTSDFSLFELRPGGAGAVSAIKRIAVSDHILLGGDNIDLALAHLVEPRLAGDGGKLSGGQWDTLVARCRDLKERALSDDGSPDQVFPLSIPGRGSGLVAGALSAQLTRTEIEAVLLDGFFPKCDADARPYKTRTGLKEWGLPFAADSAVTRHLADFLRDRPRVDAVLFNGGALYPERLRERLQREIGKWQQGDPPPVLDNPEPDLAVARGAARFGKILHQRTERIEAGAARAVFLEAHEKSSGGGEGRAAPSLVCVLPRGAAPEQTFEIADRPLELRINRPVRFQAHSSTRHGKAKAGDVVDWNDRDFHPLPALETVARVEDGEGTVPVALAAKLNELGLLQVSCVSTDPDLRRTWPLEFNLRPHERDVASGAAAVQAEANADPKAVAAAGERIRSLFGQPLKKKDKLSATRLLASLEKILGMPKGEWNWVLVRALWPALEGCMACRRTSIEHEEAWLILAGFLLRPGFGAPLDEARIDGLWKLRDAGLCFPGKRIKLQEYILWRRLAGGLTRRAPGEDPRPRNGSHSQPAEPAAGAGPPRRLARTPWPRDQDRTGRAVHRRDRRPRPRRQALRPLPLGARPAAQPSASLRRTGNRRLPRPGRTGLRGVRPARLEAPGIGGDADPVPARRPRRRQPLARRAQTAAQADRDQVGEGRRRPTEDREGPRTDADRAVRTPRPLRRGPSSGADFGLGRVVSVAVPRRSDRAGKPTIFAGAGWRCRQSRANSSVGTDSLLQREKTGKFCQVSPD